MDPHFSEGAGYVSRESFIAMAEIFAVRFAPLAAAVLVRGGGSAWGPPW